VVAVALDGADQTTHRHPRDFTVMNVPNDTTPPDDESGPEDSVNGRPEKDAVTGFKLEQMAQDFATDVRDLLFRSAWRFWKRPPGAEMRKVLETLLEQTATLRTFLHRHAECGREPNSSTQRHLVQSLHQDPAKLRLDSA
jgi:hypothetical protein